MIFRKKIYGSSLIEVVIAIVILMTIAGISVLTIQNMFMSGKNEITIIASQKVDQLLINSLDNENFEDETIEYKNLNIKKKCTWKSDDIVEILFTVSNKTGILVYEYKGIYDVENK